MGATNEVPDVPIESAVAPSLVSNQRSLARTVLLLALPVLAQQFLILFVGLSDRYLAGHLASRQQAEALGQNLIALGSLGGSGGLAAGLTAESAWQAGIRVAEMQIAFQAAQTTANYLAWFITCYTVLVSVGSTALVARCVGGGDWDRATHVANQSLLLAILLGIVGSTLGLTFMDPLINALQLRGDAAVFARLYLQPIFWLLVFQVVESAGIACLVGAGDTMTGFLVLGGVAVLNLPLSWGLCRGHFYLPRLGFPGIALGTALSHTLGCLAVLTVLARGRKGLKLSLAQFWPNTHLLGRMLRVSVPAGADSLSVVAGQFWFLGIVNQLGVVASGAHGIALGWEALGFLSGSAFGTAAMALVGQHLGARQPDQAARSAWVAFGMGCGVMTAMGALFFTLAPQMFAVFCPSEIQQPIVAAGVPVLRLIAFAMPALASTIIFTYALRGAGDTRVPVLFTWIGFLGVRIPLAYLFTCERIDLAGMSIPGFNLGLFGAWLAMSADIVVRGTFFFVRFAGGKWKLVHV